MISNPGRRIPALLAVGATLFLAVSGAHESAAETGRTASATTTTTRVAFHDAMRKLWEDHITWTRLAIVSFAHDLPDLGPTKTRLLANQADIGNAIAPYYGEAAADRLTALLQQHIAGAVALLEAAKAGDQALIQQRSDAWYANGNDIADFLSEANPRNWPRPELRRMMKTHLDQTLSEAVNRLGGNYEADLRDYEAIHRHILEMADVLSAGIIKQFPRRFRAPGQGGP